MKRCIAVLFLALVCALPLTAQESALFKVLPDTRLTSETPTIAKLTGVDWGVDILEPAQTLSYAQALAASVPAKVRLQSYARSLEGRELVLLLISSAENISRLDDVRRQLVELGDSRLIGADRSDALIKSLPAVVWIQGSVHGDEASGGDAALALAYYFAAGQSAQIDEILKNTIVVIDPMQNPDGRARFVASVKQTRGVQPDPEPASAERSQSWPGGRGSHDLFDLNRDWFALTHPETLGRVQAMLQLPPVVTADLHEMGADQGFFFAPPAGPLHPAFSNEQRALWDSLGRGNAAAFDIRGYRYWTREVFDSFYPGYGESWPSFTGAAGMTFEQGSSRGAVVRLEDDSLLTYRDAMQHQLVAAFTTCQTVAKDKERFIRGWFGFRQEAVQKGTSGEVRAYAWELGRDGRTAAELADLLARQGIEVFRCSATAEGLPAGSYIVPLSQPLGRLARTLLEPAVSLEEAFAKEQERRDKKRLPDEIYDATAWSLPLLWNVKTKTLAKLPAVNVLERVLSGSMPSGQVIGNGKVAFVLEWTGLPSARALASLLKSGVKTAVAGKPFVIAKHRFDRGAIVIRRFGNSPKLDETLATVAKSTGVDFIGVDSGYADEGIDLGSNNVFAIKPPRIVLAWDSPTSSQSAGQIRHIFERDLGYPVTVVRTTNLRGLDLTRCDVIILPDSWDGSGYTRLLGEDGFRRLANWVRDGGVLIGIGGGAAAFCEEKISLLSSKLEKRAGSEEAKPKDKAGKPEEKTAAPTVPFDYDSAVKPVDEAPPSIAGAILNVGLETENLLAAGFPAGQINVWVNSNRVFVPLKLDEGVNVGIYADEKDLIQSGFVLQASKRQLPKKAFLMVQGQGRGKVIAFAEDPSTRAIGRSTMLLLANAVFFGKAVD